MLRCKDIPALSDDYLENNLPFKKKASLTLHLAICKHCRHYLSNLQTTVNVVKNSDPLPVDSQKIDEVMRRIAAEAKDKNS